MNAHNIHKGVCTQCGCDTNAIDYFGWSCSGRIVNHTFRNGICVNCGFCREVVEHFDWPCRLDPRFAFEEPASEPSADPRRKNRKRSEAAYDADVQSWKYTTDEVRYGRVLGLRGKVTRWDIRCAYREQASLYHPDKVAHMASDIQELATEKMKEINMAFAFFQHKYHL